MPKDFIEIVSHMGFIPLQEFLYLYRKYTMKNIEVVSHMGEIKATPLKKQSKAVFFN